MKKKYLVFLIAIPIFCGIVLLCLNAYGFAIGLIACNELSLCNQKISLLGSSGSPSLPLEADQLPTISLFDSPECLTECWQNLRIGESTSEDIKRVFSQMSDSITYFELADNIEYSIPYERSGFGVSAYLDKHDLLQKLRFSGYFNLTLEEIIDRLGVPPQVEIGIRSTHFIDIYEPILLVFYPKQGYLFYFAGRSGVIIEDGHESNAVELCFDESILVATITIVSSGTITEFKDNLGYVENTHKIDFEFGCFEVKN